MKVIELIALLKKFPQQIEVIVSSDEEGNSFSDLYQATYESMTKDGRFYEATDGKPNSVVLWPT